MTEKKKVPSFTSPKGSLKYPKLAEPDYGTKEYPCPQGRYATKLVMKADDPATKAFIEKLMPLYDEAMAEAEQKFAELKVETRKKLKAVSRNELFTTLYDKDTEEPTGEIEFNFKMDASGIANKGKDNERKWSAKPGVFDAKGKPMTKVPEIWSGSIGKVSFEARPYFINGTAAAGLSLKLKAAQIIELRQGGTRSADSYGFGEEEGYEYDESDATEDSGADTSSAETNTVEDEDVPF